MITGGLLAVGSSALFTGKVIVAKLAYQRGIDPLGLVTLRMVFACPFFLFILLYALRKGVRIGKRDAFLAMGLGMLGYYLSSMLDFYGIQYISTALERMILQLSPSVVMIIGVLFMREHFDFRLLASMTVGYIGVGFMVYSEIGGATSAGHAFNQWIGILCLVGCVVFFAFYVIGAERIMRRVDSGIFTSFAMIGASIGVCVHYVLARGITAPTHDAQACLLGLIMAVFCTVVPSYMVNMAIHKIGGARIGPFNYVGMGLTFVLSAMVVDESFPVVKLVGIALAVGGAMMLTFSRRKQVS
jgi:drug/metabolite transporter (DMT)-like permease